MKNYQEQWLSRTLVTARLILVDVCLIIMLSGSCITYLYRVPFICAFKIIFKTNLQNSRCHLAFLYTVLVNPRSQRFISPNLPALPHVNLFIFKFSSLQLSYYMLPENDFNIPAGMKILKRSLCLSFSSESIHSKTGFSSGTSCCGRKRLDPGGACLLGRYFI